jgi:hypothetical protein
MISAKSDAEIAKPIMNAIIRLIETWLQTRTVSKQDFKKVDETMEEYYENFNKKNPHARQFDSHLSMWMIHEREYLPGTPHSNGGPPYYFWEQIEEAVDNI